MENSVNKRAIFGVLLVVVGGVFLLKNLGFDIEIPRYLFTWEIILVVIGVINLISGNRQAGYILIAIGTFFYLQHFDIIDARTFWPVLLIIVGVIFILRGKSAIIQSGENSMNFFDEVAIFGGSQKKLVSQRLEGGKITSVFGGSEIDLRDAKPIDGAVIEVFAMFGGSEIIVPDNWNINVDVTAILGGFSDSRKNIVDENAVNVKIKGFVILGGGELRS